jgi:hypothetical protein
MKDNKVPRRRLRRGIRRRQVRAALNSESSTPRPAVLSLEPSPRLTRVFKVRNPRAQILLMARRPEGQPVEDTVRSPVSWPPPSVPSSPERSATAAASSRLVTCSLRRMLLTWTLAVFSLMNSSRPI